MIDKIIVSTWYASLLEECKDAFVEAEFTSRWALIEGYHNVGKLILAEYDHFEQNDIYGHEISQRLATSLGKSQRTVEYAIAFAKKFDTVDMLPEGKNTNWNQVIKKHLTQPKEKEEHEHNYIEICAICREKKNG